MPQYYPIYWDLKADKALDEIYAYYLENHSQQTADKLQRAIIDKIELLIEHPQAYPPESLLKELPGDLRYIIVRHFKVI